MESGTSWERLPARLHDLAAEAKLATELLLTVEELQRLGDGHNARSQTNLAQVAERLDAVLAETTRWLASLNALMRDVREQSSIRNSGD